MKNNVKYSRASPPRFSPLHYQTQERPPNPSRQATFYFPNFTGRSVTLSQSCDFAHSSNREASLVNSASRSTFEYELHLSLERLFGVVARGSVRGASRYGPPNRTESFLNSLALRGFTFSRLAGSRQVRKTHNPAAQIKRSQLINII